MEQEEIQDDNNLENKKPQLGDKIFGAHNNPTNENDFRENFDLDTQHKFLEDTFDEEEYLYRKKLEETVFTAFQRIRNKIWCSF